MYDSQDLISIASPNTRFDRSTHTADQRLPAWHETEIHFRLSSISQANYLIRAVPRPNSTHRVAQAKVAAVPTAPRYQHLRLRNVRSRDSSILTVEIPGAHKVGSSGRLQRPYQAQLQLTKCNGAASRCVHAAAQDPGTEDGGELFCFALCSVHASCYFFSGGQLDRRLDSSAGRSGDWKTMTVSDLRGMDCE